MSSNQGSGTDALSTSPFILLSPHSTMVPHHSVEKPMSQRKNSGKSIAGAHSIQELCSMLKVPRKILLLVKAGPAVDDFIAQLEPFLEKGDCIIDGGNSHFPDSIRRTKELEAKGLLFVGSGVSGGEEGARYGPSLSEFDSTASLPSSVEVIVGASSILTRLAFCSARRITRRLALDQGHFPKDCGSG